ncbi:MAG: protein-glutamate O-methyltransferase CheR [Planctomycetota bacterium]
MKTETYNYICQFVRKGAGIVLDESKEYLVRARLKEVVRHYEMQDLDELGDALKKEGNPRFGLGKYVLESMTTNETSFFRDINVYKSIKETLFPDLLTKNSDTRKIRFWSAAASTGQESYSLTMLWLEQFVRPNWEFHITATDINEAVLDRARAGRFTRMEAHRGLPAKYLVKYFDEIDSMWEISEKVKKHVNFLYQNLFDPFSVPGKFDIVFCRNVLIYFDAEDKKAILKRLMEKLKPDGFLVLGSSETVFGLVDNLQGIPGGATGIYTRKP